MKSWSVVACCRSDYRFKILFSVLILFAFLILLFIPSQTNAGQVTIAWDPSDGPDVAGYIVYYGESSRNYEFSIDVGNTTSTTLFDLAEANTYYIAATAYDVYGIQSDFSEELVVTVESSVPNEAPVADAGPDQNILEGVLATLSAANSYDPDDGIASYLWTQESGTPVELSDPTAIKPTFQVPYVGSSGEVLVFKVTVTDYSGLQDSDTCTINVISENIPPTADAGGDQEVMEGTVVMLDGSSSFDPDDWIASYKWEQISGIPVTIYDADLSQPTFVAPDVGPEGASLAFRLTVTDSSGLQAEDTCVVNVSWVNEPPVADAGASQKVKPGEIVMLDGSGSHDPDDGIASYQWTQLKGYPVTLSDPTAVQPEFVAPYSRKKRERLVFKLEVTDKNGLKSTDKCVVVVKR